MDNRPIGFFDSGLGGLTSIPYLKKQLPEERIIYFGDTARTPYGSKAESTIRTFSREISDFLVKNDVKMIVIACNTVTSICLDELRLRHPQVPIVGIIQPAVDEICSFENETNVGVIGTKVTVSSETYSKGIGACRKDIKVFEKACPAFVPLIEEGIIDNEIMDLTIDYYLKDFIRDENIDTLVLGCTHYPLIEKRITRKYPKLKIINPSELVVRKIESILRKSDQLALNSDFNSIFYASDLSENFVNMINTIFDKTDVRVEFKSFDLDVRV